MNEITKIHTDEVVRVFKTFDEAVKFLTDSSCMQTLFDASRAVYEREEWKGYELAEQVHVDGVSMYCSVNGRWCIKVATACTLKEKTT